MKRIRGPSRPRSIKTLIQLLEIHRDHNDLKRLCSCNTLKCLWPSARERLQRFREWYSLFS